MVRGHQLRYQPLLISCSHLSDSAATRLLLRWPKICLSVPPPLHHRPPLIHQPQQPLSIRVISCHHQHWCLDSMGGSILLLLDLLNLLTSCIYSVFHIYLEMPIELISLLLYLSVCYCVLYLPRAILFERDTACH